MTTGANHLSVAGIFTISALDGRLTIGSADLCELLLGAGGKPMSESTLMRRIKAAETAARRVAGRVPGSKLNTFPLPIARPPKSREWRQFRVEDVRAHLVAVGLLQADGKPPSVAVTSNAWTDAPTGERTVPLTLTLNVPDLPPTTMVVDSLEEVRTGPDGREWRAPSKQVAKAQKMADMLGEPVAAARQSR